MVSLHKAGRLYRENSITYSTTYTTLQSSSSNNRESEWTSDFDDFIGDNSFQNELSSLFSQRQALDRSGCRVRQFSLGADLVLSNYVGSLGFDEVTDWEYVSVLYTVYMYA
jgi:hypothetical protein